MKLRLAIIGAGPAGLLLAHLLQRYPGMRGTLLEQPGVIEDGRVPWAERLGVAQVHRRR